MFLFDNVDREVSEDHAYDTIEFNEFLQLMSKEMNRQLTNKDLIDAFRSIFIIQHAFLSVQNSFDINSYFLIEFLIKRIRDK